jgi:hypothetical protein
LEKMMAANEKTEIEEVGGEGYAFAKQSNEGE